MAQVFLVKVNVWASMAFRILNLRKACAGNLGHNDGVLLAINVMGCPLRLESGGKQEER